MMLSCQRVPGGSPRQTWHWLRPIGASFCFRTPTRGERRSEEFSGEFSLRRRNEVMDPTKLEQHCRAKVGRMILSFSPCKKSPDNLGP